MLRLRTFGGLTLSRGEENLTGAVTQRRRLALLALLAVARDTGLSRDKLLAWLWPDADAERARHVLNQLLYAQRRQVGDAALFTGQKTLRLNRVVMTTDVGEFLDAMERGALEEGVGLYKGPFLDGFFLKGGVDFEQWVEAQRGRFARQVLAALATLAERAGATGDPAAVVRWRRQASELDPLDSTLALELVRALAAAGDRQGALRHAREHADVLQTQLGLPTDDRMAQLVEELRRA
jgi:DNA-binding SARP family transcriptional activator